jgi:uncharacterized protein YndB with AHSA1/START domain
LNFELATTIAAPPEKVFRLATDPDRFHEWMPGFVRVERNPPGPIKVGSRWRETRKMMGHEAAEEFEVTTLQAPRRIDLFVDGARGSMKKGEFRFHHTFEPDGSGGTRFAMSGEVEKMGCMGAVFGFMFVGMFRKMVARDLAALKTWIEKQP